MNKTYLDVIAKYEDVNFPLNGYIDLKKEMDLKHRLRSIKKELKFCIDVINNAEKRLDLKIDIQKFDLILEKFKNEIDK